jgi:hypothetical protein
MSEQSAQRNLCAPSQSCLRAESAGLGILKRDWTNVDNRDVSAQMLTLRPAATAVTTQASAKPVTETCRHYRYCVPRELADELRDADPEPCHVCDAMPHRMSQVGRW